MWGEPHALSARGSSSADWSFIRPGNLAGQRGRGTHQRGRGGLHNPVYDGWAAQLSRPSSPYGIGSWPGGATRRPGPQAQKPWEAEYVISRPCSRMAISTARGEITPGGDCYLDRATGSTGSAPAWPGRVQRQPREQPAQNQPQRHDLQRPGTPPARNASRPWVASGFRSSQFKAFATNTRTVGNTRRTGPWRDRRSSTASAVRFPLTHFTGGRCPSRSTFEHSDGMRRATTMSSCNNTSSTRARGWSAPRRHLERRPPATDVAGEKNSHGSGRRVVRSDGERHVRNFPFRAGHRARPGRDVPVEQFYTSIHATVPGRRRPPHGPHHLDIRDDITSIGLWRATTRVWNRVPGTRPKKPRPRRNGTADASSTFPSLFERPMVTSPLPYKGYNLPHKYPARRHGTPCLAS